SDRSGISGSGRADELEGRSVLLISTLPRKRFWNNSHFANASAEAPQGAGRRQRRSKTRSSSRYRRVSPRRHRHFTGRSPLAMTIATNTIETTTTQILTGHGLG